MSLEQNPVGGRATGQYFDRMAAASGDKARLVDYLPDGRDLEVLDFGAGGGVLTGALASSPRVRSVVAVDNSPESIDRLGGENVTTVLGGTEWLAEQPAGSFDAVVFCSVLHEVWSSAYMNELNSHLRLPPIATLHASITGDRAWLVAVTEAERLLRPGGRLIIRDGVAPSGTERVRLAPHDPELSGLLHRYRRDAPYLLRERLYIESGNTIVGAPQSAVEALLTAGWGPESFDREINERYALFTLDETRNIVTQATKLSPVEAIEYTQQGYRDHLDGRVSVERINRDTVRWEPWFPSTNAVWVFEK